MSVSFGAEARLKSVRVEKVKPLNEMNLETIYYS